MNLWLVLIAIALIVVSGLLIAAETAMTRVSKTRIDELRKEGNGNEKRAELVWRRLDALGISNIYVLAGGVNGWIATYCPQICGEDGIETAKYEPSADDSKVEFPLALGDRYELSRPELEEVVPRDFTPVVKLQKASRDLGGGCG